MDEQPWSMLKARIYSFFSRDPKSSRMLIEALELDRSDATLDIGCGPGAAVRIAAGVAGRAVGVDASPGMVEIARRRSGDLPAEFVTGSAEDLPFDDDSFTEVWTVRSYHHWSDRDAGMGEARRVLRPGGRFHIVENDTRGKHGLSPAGARDTARLLERAGFTDVAIDRLGKMVHVTARRP